jgi:hypothetical protein
MVVHLLSPVASAKPAYANFHGLQEKAPDRYEYFAGTIYTSSRALVTVIDITAAENAD